MKAKEYAKKYIESGETLECLEEILKNFYDESISLMKNRGAKSDSALFSIWDELDLKWRSFCSKITSQNLATDGFKMVVEVRSSEGYNAWMQYKGDLYVPCTRETIIREILQRHKNKEELCTQNKINK